MSVSKKLRGQMRDFKLPSSIPLKGFDVHVYENQYLTSQCDKTICHCVFMSRFQLGIQLLHGKETVKFQETVWASLATDRALFV